MQYSPSGSEYFTKSEMSHEATARLMTMIMSLRNVAELHLYRLIDVLRNSRYMEHPIKSVTAPAIIFSFLYLFIVFKKGDVAAPATSSVFV